MSGRDGSGEPACPTTACITSGWGIYDGACRSDDGYARSVLHRSAEHEIAATLWPRGAQGQLHGHGASSTWLRVISGELEEERYELGEGGEWRYQRITLRAGDTSSLAAGALHRMRASRAAEVVMTFSPPPAQAVCPIADEQREALRRARWRAVGPQPSPGRAGSTAPRWEHDEE